MFQPEMVDEYRTSIQAPGLTHAVRGQRINRQQAKVTDHQGKVRRVWKVLECPQCGVRLHRDMSAAFAMALNQRWKALSDAEPRVERVPMGYAR